MYYYPELLLIGTKNKCISHVTEGPAQPIQAWEIDELHAAELLVT